MILNVGYPGGFYLRNLWRSRIVSIKLQGWKVRRLLCALQRAVGESHQQAQILHRITLAYIFMVELIKQRHVP